MALFGRKSQNNDVPEDLQQYYNTSTSSGALKWVLRIVAGLVVLALLIGGGIWLAKKISGSSSKDTPQTAQQRSADQRKAQQDAAKAQADAKKAAEEAQKKAAEAAKKEQEAAQKEQAAQQPPQTATNNTGSTPSTGSGSSSTGTTQPAPTTTQGTSNSNLPNTGPGETAAVLFTAATVLGTAAHFMVTRKRQLQ